MKLFLVTCVCDEGMNEGTDYSQLVLAESRLAVAELILNDPWSWRIMLERSRLWDVDRLDVGHRRFEKEWAYTASEFLQAIDDTRVDGDSRWQLAITELTEIIGARGDRLDIGLFVNELVQ